MHNFTHKKSKKIMSYKKIKALIFLITLNNLLQAGDNTPLRSRNWMLSFFGSCMQRTAPTETTNRAHASFEPGEYAEIINPIAQITPPLLAQATVVHTENEEMQNLRNQIAQNDEQIQDLETSIRTERQRHHQTLLSRTRLTIERDQLQRQKAELEKLAQRRTEQLAIMKELAQRRTEQLAIMENSAQELTLDLQEKEDNYQILIEIFSQQFNQQADELEKTLFLKLKSQNMRLDKATTRLTKISTRFTAASEE
jgi:hypothetical protein